MNSAKLAEFGFANWNDLSLAGEKSLLASLPRSLGVYVIRDTTEFGRYRGKSDLVYIGSATGKDGLRKRIRFYFHPGPTQATSQRIHRMLNIVETLQIAWILSNSAADATSLEKQLLAKYSDQHLELPPFNRQA